MLLYFQKKRDAWVIAYSGSTELTWPLYLCRSSYNIERLEEKPWKVRKSIYQSIRNTSRMSQHRSQGLVIWHLGEKKGLCWIYQTTAPLGTLQGPDQQWHRSYFEDEPWYGGGGGERDSEEHSLCEWCTILFPARWDTSTYYSLSPGLFALFTLQPFSDERNF